MTNAKKVDGISTNLQMRSVIRLYAYEGGIRHTLLRRGASAQNEVWLGLEVREKGQICTSFRSRLLLTTGWLAIYSLTWVWIHVNFYRDRFGCRTNNLLFKICLDLYRKFKLIFKFSKTSQLLVSRTKD